MNMLLSGAVNKGWTNHWATQVLCDASGLMKVTVMIEGHVTLMMYGYGYVQHFPNTSPSSLPQQANPQRLFV